MKQPLYFLCILALLFSFASCQEENPSYGSGNAPEMPETHMGKDKLVIYQMMTRLFGNKKTTNATYGTHLENGVGKFSDVTENALGKLREMGFTHIWYTGVLEHATMTDYSAAGAPADDADVVKGRAGSPYAIKDYYDVAPDLATDPTNRMAEFTALIRRTQAEGLKVLMDFVPNHVARSYHSDAKPEGTKDLGEGDDSTLPFSPKNNFYYLPKDKFSVPAEHNPLGDEVAVNEDDRFDESPAKATGNNVFMPDPSVGDWFETAKLNYGVDELDWESKDNTHFEPIPNTWKKMRDILLFWSKKGVDGFRCDMAEMVPVEFWAWVIPEVKMKYPDVTFIAEIYNPKRYVDYVKKGQFDYLYDKVGVYDTIRELMSGEGSTAKIAAALAQSEGIEHNMLRFLENHDEQRIASADFAGTLWAAVPGMTVSALLGKGPILIYFGQESGEPGKGEEGFQKEDGRTTIFDYWGVPEHQKWMNGGKFDGGRLSEDQKALRKFYKDLLYLCRYDETIQSGDFKALPVEDEKVYGFFRYSEGRHLLVLTNFDREAEREAVVSAESWESVGLKTTGAYGGSSFLVDEEFSVDDTSFEKGPLKIMLPPLSASVFELKPL